MADNRVVIKINYDKDQRRKEVIDPRMVTIWHKGRVLVALSILALLVIILILLWPIGDEANNKVVTRPEGLALENNPTKPSEVQTPEESQNISIPSGRPIELNKPRLSPAKPAAVILDKRVIRASLNIALKDQEPRESALSPVFIETGKNVELFYFSQVKSMRSKVLFHRWLKDGQLVLKKQLNIKDDKSKLISSRIFTPADTGNWQVVMVDASGKVFSQVDFKVDMR